MRRADAAALRAGDRTSTVARLRLPSPAMVVALVALVFSTTGLADAARHAVISAIGGHRQHKPHAGGLLLLGKNRKFPASAIPTVRNAKRVDGKTAERARRDLPAGHRRPRHLVHGLGALSADEGRRRQEQLRLGEQSLRGRRRLAADGGATLGAADRVKLESTIHDSPLTATIDQDPSRGLKDEREMSSTLVTTEAGSAAAGSEGVSEGATGDPRQGQPNPVPLPANPLPESLQYVTVYSNRQQGGFAGSEPVNEPENFRCAFNLSPGALNKSELEADVAVRRTSHERPAELARCRRDRAGRRAAASLSRLVPARARSSFRRRRSTGPSEEIVGFGGVAMAEDGTGGLVFLKRVEAWRTCSSRVTPAATGWRRSGWTPKSPMPRAGRGSGQPKAAS